MRPQQVIAGPFAAATTNKVALVQQNYGAGGALALNGAATTLAATSVCASQSPGSAAFTINGSQAVGGVAYLGTNQYIYIVNGGDSHTITVTVVGQSGLNNIVVKETITLTNAQYVASVNTYNNILSITPSGAVTGTVTVGSYSAAVLDTPRRVVITSAGNESANTATITGTNWAGYPVTETIALANIGTVTSAMDYLTVSKVTVAVAAAGNISVGTTAGTAAVITNPVAASPWVRLDPFAGPNASIQCVVSGAGTINYVVQTSNDDPAMIGSAIQPQNMTWSLSPDAAVGTAGTPALTSVASFFTNVPVFARVLVEFVNTTTVSVAMTVAQTGVAPY